MRGRGCLRMMIGNQGQIAMPLRVHCDGWAVTHDDDDDDDDDGTNQYKCRDDRVNGVEGLTKDVCMNRIDNERCSARTVNVMMLQL